MSKIVVITNVIKNEPYAVVSYNSSEIKVFALNEEANEWAEWANQSCKSVDDIRDGLAYFLQTELPRPATEMEIKGLEKFATEKLFNQIKSEIIESKLELVDSFSSISRRFVVKSNITTELPDDISSLPLTSFKQTSRQAMIEYKALSFRADNKYSNTAFESKGARALWDPDLGPSGGWRCPSGSQFGGYITDRFGRGCGGGILRRVGRALADAGRGIDKLGEARGAKRRARAVSRLEKPQGGQARRAVGNAANALERGAQRLVGEYKPGEGRGGRRGISAPKISSERRTEINNRLADIQVELDNLVDQSPTPDIQKRITELTDENKKLRRERDGATPKLISAVAPAPSKRRVVKPEAGRGKRVQGSRPVKKPVSENRRQGVLDRAAERLVGGYEPSEYKPGDKKRIKDRENRYAKVSNDALANALEMNSPKPTKPGQNRNIEANKRQERLEVLQEMLNRGIDIPEQFKKEVKQYRLKPQRKKRGAKAGTRRERAALALERAAQRVLNGKKGKKRRDRSRRVRASDVPKRDSQRARTRSTVTAQSAFTPIRRPQPKKMKGDKIAWDDMDAQQKNRMRDRAIAELDDIDSSWRKRLGLNQNEELTDKMIRDYIKERENNKPGAFIGVLKANANDWGVLKDYANDIENGDILNNLGPKRRKKLVDEANLIDDLIRTPIPKRVRTPDKGRTLNPSEMRRLEEGWARERENAKKRDGLKTAEKTRFKELDGPYFDSPSEGFQIAEALAKENNESMVVFQQDGKFHVVKAQEFNDLLDSIDDDTRMRNAIGSVRYFDANGNESKIDVSESSRVKQSIKESLGVDAPESLGGSIPDERSRRNVRNRFPNNGLPEKAFWRDKDWKARTGGDDADKHERRFGRYFDTDGNINIRGRLVNQQLKKEREEASKPRFSKTPVSIIPQPDNDKTSVFDFGKLRVVGEDNNKRVLWKDKDGFIIADNIVNVEALRQRYMRYAKDGRDAYLNGAFAQDIIKKIDGLLVNNDPDKRRDLRNNLQNLIDDRRALIARDNPVVERGKFAGELVALQNMLNELDSHPNAVDFSPPKNEVLDSLPKASVRRRDGSLIKSTRFEKERQRIIGMQDERNNDFKNLIAQNKLDEAEKMINGVRENIKIYKVLLEGKKDEDERINLLAMIEATRDQLHKFEQDFLFKRQSMKRKEAKKKGTDEALQEAWDAQQSTPTGSADARLAILGNNYQKKINWKVKLPRVQHEARLLAREKGDNRPVYVAKDKKSKTYFLLSWDDYQAIVDNDAFYENYTIEAVEYAPQNPLKKSQSNQEPDYKFPFFKVAKQFVMEHQANDEDGAYRDARKFAVEFGLSYNVVKRKSDGRLFTVNTEDYIAFTSSGLDTSDYESIFVTSPWGRDSAGKALLNKDKKQFIKNFVDNGDGVFNMNNGKEEAKKRAEKYAQDLANINGRLLYIIDDGDNYVVLNSKDFYSLIDKFNNDTYGLKITLKPQKIVSENQPKGAGKDGLVGPRKMQIDADEYKNAVVAVHDENASLEDISDPLFAAVVFDENMVDAKGNPLEDSFGDLVNFEDIFNGTFQPDEDFEFENTRFKFTQKKENVYKDPDYGDLWSVYKVEDKVTGQKWWIKASAYGLNDALLEDVGMEAAAIFNFAAKNDPKHIRISGVVNHHNHGRPLRWTAMQDIDQWEPPANGDQLSWVDARDGGGLDGDKVSLEDMANIFVMDYVLDNQDRHGHNFKVATDANGVQRLGIIDNGLMFGGRAYDLLNVSRFNKLTKAEINQVASDREALNVKEYAEGTGNILISSFDFPKSFKDRLINSQFARDEFNLQVKYAIETMRENIDKILDEQRLDNKGIKLDATELAHLKAMKIVADARLKYIEANPNAFAEFLGVTSPNSTSSPINAPMSPIRRPKGFTGRQAGLPSGGGL